MRLSRLVCIGVVLLAFRPVGASAQEPPVGGDRAKIVQALDRAKLLDDRRILTHVSHVCNLRIDGEWYPVADVREMIPRASIPRGYNRIVVFDSKLEVKQEIEYLDARPLFCQGNELFLGAKLYIRNELPGGNILVFEDGAKRVAYRTLDPNRWPTRSEAESSRKK